MEKKLFQMMINTMLKKLVLKESLHWKDQMTIKITQKKI